MFFTPVMWGGSRDDQASTGKSPRKASFITASVNGRALSAGCAALSRRTGRLGSLLPEEVAGDDDAHDLVGAFEDLMHPQIAQIALDREILEIAVAAMQLQRLVGDMKPGVGREALCHRALFCCFR